MTIKKVAALGIAGFLLVLIGVNLIENDAIGFWQGCGISFVGTVLMAGAIILGDSFTVDPDEAWRNRKC